MLLSMIRAASADAADVATDAAEGTAGNGLTSMANMLDTLLVVMMIGCAIYAIYTVIRLKREYMLFDNKLLYPGNCPYLECKDPQGFIDFIWLRLLILGIALLVFGGLIALNRFVELMNPTLFGILTIFMPLAVFVWYIIVQRKAAKRFW